MWFLGKDKKMYKFLTPLMEKKKKRNTNEQISEMKERISLEILQSFKYDKGIMNNWIK